MDFYACFRAYRQLQIAAAAMELNVPGALAGQAMSAQDMTTRLELPDMHRLRRLLRGMVWAGLARVESGGTAPTFALTSAGMELLHEQPPSAADDLHFEVTFQYGPWSHLADWVRDGVTPFDRMHGESVWQRLARDPSAAAAYARPLSARTLEYAHALASHPHVATARRLIDVGGGEGMLAVELLRLNDRATAMIYDQPAMRSGAEAMIQRLSLENRCTFQTGDFFESIPSGADVYLLKWILHDFDDESCVALLKSCAKALGETARLLVIERPVPEGEAAAAQWVQPDLNMLCLSGGSERTLVEYRTLLERAGLVLETITPLEAEYGFAVLTARRAGSQ